MIDYQQYFTWTGVQLHYYFIYFALAAIISFYLTLRSNSKYRLELFFVSFYLLTGNINELLTIKIPGFSLFEIQPIRFLFFLLTFFIIRKTALSRKKYFLSVNGKLPWFQVALLGYVGFLVASMITHSQEIGIATVLRNILDALTFLVLLIALQLMADKPSYDLIGRSIIIGAVVSSIVSLIQLSIDPYFLRIGDARPAFGGILRSNGIFSAEYFNSYYLIIAITWTLTTIKNNYLKIALTALFSLGILSSFQRMSWIILILVIVTYLVYIEKLAIEKLVLTVFCLLTIGLSISIFYSRDIMNSSLVRERLSEKVEGREGYYAMVLDNIGKKPLFGYGDLKNEVYYANMLRITGNRDRATAEEGDLHSGYFSALFLYGIPAFICFLLFALLSVFYYARSFQENLYFIIPFLLSIVYLIGNLTNNFLFLKYLTVLYAIHIGIGMGINQLRAQSVSEN